MPAESLARFKAATRALLNQGLSRRRLALTLAAGITLGVLPSLWGSSLACALLAAALGLNQIVIQFANYLAYPLQILLFIPYVRLGALLFGGGSEAFGLNDLQAAFQQDFGATLLRLGAANLKAIGAWGVGTPLLGWGCYLLFSAILRLMEKRQLENRP